MKTYIKKLVSFSVIALMLSACIREKNVFDGGEVKPAIITFDAGSRATDHPGDAPDRVVGSLRVLIYKSNSGVLVFNIVVPTTPMPAKLNILTGTYDFVFIANEDSDMALKAKLTTDSDIDNISKLRALFWARNAFSASANVPMVTYVNYVQVTGDDTFKTPTMSSFQTGTWDVGLERVGIRLKLVIEMTAMQYSDWLSTSIIIKQIPSGAYVLPGIDNSASYASNASFGASTSAGSAPGLITGPDAGKYTVTYDRLILPESFFIPNSNAGKALELEMNFYGSVVKSGKIFAQLTEGLGYTLPRNTYLLLNATVKEDAIEVDAEVVPWNDAGLEDCEFDGQYHMKVNNAHFLFLSPAGSQTLELFTDYPYSKGGWTIDSKVGSWITAPAVNSTPTAPGTYPITITCTQNSGSLIRTGSFVIKAGNLRKTIYVVQLPANPPDGPDPEGFLPYVGAYWKANQTGERLIRIKRPTAPDPAAADGVWTAAVLSGDWIVLDKEPSSDANIWNLANESSVADMNDPAKDGLHRVPVMATTTSNMVSGVMDASNPQIYFRIGLKTTHMATPSAPVRYGVVLLAYKNNTLSRRIFIRQGEEADYLMRDGDAFGPGTGSPVPANRTESAKFLPYNLTASDAEWLANGGGTNYINHPKLAPRGGSLTKYPTQAGAYFQWSVRIPGDTLNHARRAYHPSNPTSAGITGWNSMSGFSGFWKDAANPNHSDVSEVCPPGYKRPNDGSESVAITSNIAASEIRQSLWLSPQHGTTLNYNSDNFAHGYYADGFFDRREIVSSQNADVTPTPNSTVALSTAEVAYIGGLFYNPNNNASLFFPYTGERHINDNFALRYTGIAGYYWPSSRNSGSSTFLRMHYQNFATGNQVGISSASEHYGMSIRCVSCISVSGATLSLGGSATVSVGGTVVLTAAINSNASPPITYTWQHSTNGTTWTTVATTNANTYVATVTNTGANHFKVVVSNRCNAKESNEVNVTGTIAQSAGILYRAADGTLQIGTWSVEVNQSNLLYFKFGSVIGIRNYSGSSHYVENTPWASSGGANAVWYDMTGGTYTLYDNIPYYNTGTDWPAVKNVSNPNYHHGANVKAGKGDPCKIVGLTAAKIQSMSPSEINEYQSGWRLPTKAENVNFVNAPTSFYTYDPNLTGGNYSTVYTNSSYPFLGPSPTGTGLFQGGWYPLAGPPNAPNGGPRSTNPSGFLPAAGYRGGSPTTMGSNGQVRLPEHNGFYWSSEVVRYPDNSTGVGYGYAMGFDDAVAWAPGHTFPAIHNRTLYAFTIRCTKEN